MPDAGQNGQPRRGTKAGAALAAARVSELAGLLRDGATRRDACGHVRRAEAAPTPNKWMPRPGEPPLSDSQVGRYLKKADRRLRRREDQTGEWAMCLLLCRLRRLYARAAQAGDNRTALAVLHYEARVLGLYPDQRPVRSGPAGPGGR